MPNSFAYIALLAWPLLAVLFYRRFDALTASFITIVGGYMFLPAATVIDLPLVPALGKNEIAAISAVLGCILIKNIKIYFWGITNLQKFLITTLMVIPFINIFFNNEPVFNGEIFIKGLTPYDAISAVINQYIFLIPYLIGISVVDNKQDIKKLIKYIINAGLIYSVFALIEIRLSPQLHTWIYGFFPHSFGQQIRMGGFRPVVFMGHGLLVAIFFVCCTVAAFINYRHSIKTQKLKNLVIFLYLFSILLLCKTVSAFGWLLLFLLCYILLRTLGKKLIGAMFLLFLFYPILSFFGLVPYEFILNQTQEFSVDRYNSLQTRFLNEIRLLHNTLEKWFIGWGGWGRGTFHDSVTDGHWIIVYSKYGLFYFLTYFSLYLAPLISDLKSSQDYDNRIINTIGLMLAVLLFDQLINSSLAHPWLWFIAGATTKVAHINSTIRQSANLPTRSLEELN